MAILLFIYTLSVFYILALFTILVLSVGIDTFRSEAKSFLNEDDLKLLNKISNNQLMLILVIVSLIPIVNTYLVIRSLTG